MDDSLTRWTARLSMALYAVALAGLLRARSSPPAPWVFRAWAAGCLVFLVHVLCAFHQVHGWSHAAAYAETARQTEELFGFSSGAGLYLNYVFTAVWAADALWWWRWPERYPRRPRWLNISVHAFLVFMAFNATVVFGTGPTRWLGIVSCLILAGLWWHGRDQ